MIISTRLLRAVFGALALLCAFAPERAVGQPLMTYQGRLKESGSPVTGNRNVNILFCNCLSGVCAPACAPSGLQGVTVSSGLFRTTFTVPASVDLAASQQWFLEIQVGGSALSPREQLTAGSYAVHASSAAGLAAAPGAAGVSVSSHLFVVGAGRLGVGTLLPQSELHVFTSLTGGGLRLEGGATHPTLTLANGLIKRGQLSYSNGNDFLSLTGTKAFIIKGPGDGSIELGTGDMDAFTGRVHMIVSSNTRVGVGTLSPAARLHVSSSNALASEDIFLTSSGTAAGQEVLVVKGDGRIGMGGAFDPAARLSLPADALKEIRFPPGSSNVEIESSNQMVVGTYGGGDLTLQTNAIERLRVTATGNVGIGASGPTAKLHVSGPSIFEGDVAITTGSAIGGAHLRSSQPTSPTAAASSPGCGTTGPTVAIAGTDMAGGIQLNTSTAPSGVCTVTVTFVRPYVTAPKSVVISPMGPNAGALNAFIQIAPTTSGFVLQAANPVGPTVQYNWSYIVIE